MELWSVKEVAKILQIKPQSVIKRMYNLEVKPYKKENDKSYYFDRSQMNELTGIFEKETPIVKTLHLHTVWQIYPSKMNYLKRL